MSAKAPHKQARLPRPPPPAKAKPSLIKTVSAPHAVLNRFLGHQRHSTDKETREGSDGEKAVGGSLTGNQSIDVGEDMPAAEPLPPCPTGTLIDFDTNDSPSHSHAPLRSKSVSGRPSPSLRRPPPPPPARERLATVSAGALKPPVAPRVRPLPPPKPANLSPSHRPPKIDTMPLPEADKVNGTSRSVNGEKSSAEPSPYLAFTPLKPNAEAASYQITSLASNSSPNLPHSLSLPQPLLTSEAEKTSVVTLPHPVTFPNPPPREMEYTEREHPRCVFEYLDKMRRRGDLCNVKLIAGSHEICAHKAVLVACSQYFESMFIGEFSEPDGEPIIIEEIEGDALEALVNFAYTSRIQLTDRNIYIIFAAADLLQFSGVRGACFKFFKQQMNKSNCIRTWLFADGQNCTELLDAALKYIECNFLDVIRGTEFLHLDRADVVGKLLALEDLAVTSEEQVYEAAMCWLQHDVEGRMESAVEVLKSVRFPSMSRDYLLRIVETEDIIKENSECLQMLIDALESFVTGTRTKLRKKLLKKESAYTNVKPRPASMAVETVEFCRDDQSLGLRIMGGRERPYHVFRQGDKPGIFILMVTPNGVAARTGRLKTGDRILKVNDTDMGTVTHDQAIRILKTSPDPLSLLVRHEPSPPGLQELTLVTKPGEGFGVSLSGGVNGYYGNPLDETDEGIFISQIVPGGAAERDGRLKEGTRILQVNSISMLGKTLAEALHVLQGVLDRINLLVCFGYDPTTVSEHHTESCRRQTVDTVDEFGSESLHNHNGSGGEVVV